MQKIFKTLVLSLPLCLSLACMATTASTPVAAPPPPSTTAKAIGMMAQLPAFLTQLDAARGKALTVAEKTAVTSVVSQANSTVNATQNKFLGAVAKTSGLDMATLGVLFPSATKPVNTSDLANKVESKAGAKLNFMQKTALTSAATLRNNSLESLKGSISNSVAQKVGMDPALVTGLLPLLGF